MFDLGWSKLIVIAIVAIVVVGPKDLPPLLRALGKFVAQLRRQADEFRAHFNEAMRDTGLDEVKRDIAGIRQAATDTAMDISRTLDDSVKPLHDAASDIQRAGDIPALPPEPGATAAASPETGGNHGGGDAPPAHASAGEPHMAADGLNGHGHAALKLASAPPPALQSEIHVPAGLEPEPHHEPLVHKAQA